MADGKYHRVIIALGSNRRQCVNIGWASQRLTTLLRDTLFSRIIWTKDVNGKGLMYQNRLVSGRTTLPVEELEQQLKAIEAELHRQGQEVTIDLDLMEYDSVRYHLRDWSRPYIQLLIDEIK